MYCLGSELKKVAILAIQIGERSGNLGNMLTKNLRSFVEFGDMSWFTHFWDHFQAESEKNLRAQQAVTGEHYALLGNILDQHLKISQETSPDKSCDCCDWGTFWTYWLEYYAFWETFTLFCRLDYLSRFTQFGEHFWPVVLDWGTPLHFFQLCEK